MRPLAIAANDRKARIEQRRQSRFRDQSAIAVRVLIQAGNCKNGGGNPGADRFFDCLHFFGCHKVSMRSGERKATTDVALGFKAISKPRLSDSDHCQHAPLAANRLACHRAGAGRSVSLIGRGAYSPASAMPEVHPRQVRPRSLLRALEAFAIPTGLRRFGRRTRRGRSRRPHNPERRRPRRGVQATSCPIGRRRRIAGAR